MKILLGVTGSISAYKSLDLVRELSKSGHQVKVILTKGAKEFVVPQVFRYLGAVEVYHPQDDFNVKDIKSKNPVLHVELGNWADLFVLCPLSANTLSRLCHGAADDLLTSVFLALKEDTPLLVFPAMNTQMLQHPFVQENFDKLKKLNSLENVFIHPTRSGELVCKEDGEGKLPEVGLIKDFIESFPTQSQTKKEENVLISTGATLAPLDPVRYLTNASSGKTGLHLAKYALSQGKKVKVIAGINATRSLDHLIHHPLFTLVRVVSTQDMKKEVLSSLEEYPNYISSAAIGDFSFDSSSQKIKKDSMPEALQIKPESDILKEVLASNKPKRVVGFAAESNLTESMLEAKFDKKPVDLLIGTKVNNGLLGDQVQGFQNEKASYIIMNKDKAIEQKEFSKKELAQYIFERI